jgi:Fe-S-cluster-containing hydrogenase component 2
MFVVTIDNEHCTGCAQCVEACPAQIISMVDSHAEVTGNPAECLGCQSCAVICAVEGITLEEY